MNFQLTVECSESAQEQLALIQTAQDIGQSEFEIDTLAIRNLCVRMYPTIATYIVLYKLSNSPDREFPQLKDVVKRSRSGTT